MFQVKIAVFLKMFQVRIGLLDNGSVRIGLLEKFSG
jgi:hypothetical protein